MRIQNLQNLFTWYAKYFINSCLFCGSMASRRATEERVSGEAATSAGPAKVTDLMANLTRRVRLRLTTRWTRLTLRWMRVSTAKHCPKVPRCFQTVSLMERLEPWLYKSM